MMSEQSLKPLLGPADVTVFRHRTADRLKDHLATVEKNGLTVVMDKSD